jgi:hypothetical protein
MDWSLRDLNHGDQNFAQFLKRHNLVWSDPEAWRAFYNRQVEFALEGLERSRTKAEGEAKGKAEGKVERDQEIALNALRDLPPGQSTDDVVETLRRWGISEDIVKKALEQVRAE